MQEYAMRRLDSAGDSGACHAIEPSWPRIERSGLHGGGHFAVGPRSGCVEPDDGRDQREPVHATRARSAIATALYAPPEKPTTAISESPERVS